MAFAWTRTRCSPIAIDFGAHSLKLLQVAPSPAGQPPQLVAAAAVDVPREVREDAVARQQFLAESLKELIRTHPFTGNHAVTTTPGHQTLIQHLQLSGGDAIDANLQIEDELRQRLNVEPSRMVVRHFSVGAFIRGGSSKQEVICVAAGRDAVMRQIQIAAHAGLEIVDMSCEAQAIIRAFAHLYRRADDAQRATCFVDMGAMTAKVVVAHGTEMVCAKTVRVDEMIGAAEPESQDSSVRRSTTGLAVLEACAAPSSAAPPADEYATCLIEELQLCVRYHQSMFPNHDIEKIVFLGGASRDVQRCETIARTLRISAQLGDPLARLVRSDDGSPPTGLDMRQPQPAWAVPMGLCLGHG